MFRFRLLGFGNQGGLLNGQITRKRAQFRLSARLEIKLQPQTQRHVSDAGRRSQQDILNYGLASTHKYKAEVLPPDTIAIAALRDSPSHPQRAWQDSIDRRSATASTALVCLEAYLKLLDRLPQSEATFRRTSDGLGKMTLKWIIKSCVEGDPQHAKDAVSTPGVLYATFLLLVQEGGEDYPWRLLSSSVKILDEPDPENFRYKWRGIILRNWTAAKLDIIDRNGTKDAGPAIELIGRAKNLKNQYDYSNPIASLNVRPAMHTVASKLSRTSPSLHQNTDPKQWDTFARDLEHSAPRHSSTDLKVDGLRFGSISLHLAKLDLAHPTRAGYDRALALIRKWQAKPSSSVLSYSDGPGHRKLISLLGDTATALHLQRRKAEYMEIRKLYDEQDSIYNNGKPRGLAGLPKASPPKAAEHHMPAKRTHMSEFR